MTFIIISVSTTIIYTFSVYFTSKIVLTKLNSNYYTISIFAKY